LFDVKYFYTKSKKAMPTFRIYAGRSGSNEQEQYEIEITGAKKIKKVMKQFNN